MNHDANTRVLNLVGHDSTPFEEIFAVEDSAVVPHALTIITQLQSAVDSQHVFQISQAAEIVKADPQLVLLQVRDTTLSHERIQVERMVDQVQGELNNLLAVALPAVAQEQLHAVVINVFTNLQTQQDDEWVHIEAHGGTTTYRYNMVFVVQNQETGWLFYVVPVGLSVTVDLSEQQLFALKLADKVSYRLTLQALKIGALTDQRPASRMEQ